MTFCVDAPARLIARTGSAWKGFAMRMHRGAAVMFVGLSLALRQGPAAAQSQPTTTIEGIRSELLQLPYYGVFDFIAFSYNKGVVTLQGYAYQGRLKVDAERAVKR